MAASPVIYDMTTRISAFTFALAVLALAGCQKKQVTKVETPTGTTPTASASAQVTPVKAASPRLGISEDLAKQCQLYFEPTKTPHFEYDDTALLPQDREVLDRVATCVTTGPLKGRGLELVGRADPRGTQEYNLALGDRRASSVRTYLQRLGVAPTQLATKTRGDLDATGQDESSWRHDRRVDIVLRN